MDHKPDCPNHLQMIQHKYDGTAQDKMARPKLTIYRLFCPSCKAAEIISEKEAEKWMA